MVIEDFDLFTSIPVAFEKSSRMREKVVESWTLPSNNIKTSSTNKR